MTATTTLIPFFGLTCRHCGYDLRGLRRPICPECGRLYEPPATRRMPRWLCPGAAMLSSAISWGVASLCVHVPSIYAGQAWADCGTGLIDLDFRMTAQIPVLLALAAATCVIARKSRLTGSLARCALGVAAGAWLITFITYNHVC